MVFDTSNSIDGTEGAQMEAAAKDFVDALSGTPSEVAVTYFRGISGSGGTGIGGTQIGWTDISDNAGTTDVKNAIDSFSGWGGFGDQGGTNWEDGFNTVDAFTPKADVVLFMTDGNPTTHNGAADSGSVVHDIDVDKGTTEANQVKGTGARIVGVGIGSGVTVSNLVLISGNGVNDDYYLASGFNDLKTKLPQIALELCEGTVTVKKLVDDQEASGWTFNATDQNAKVTDGDGLVNFDWSQTGGESTPVTITEVLQDGHSFVSAVCKQGDDIVDTSAAGTISEPGVSFTLDLDAIVTCEFSNETETPPDPTTLTLVKNVDGGTADASAWTLTATGDGEISGNGTPATGTVATLGPNDVTASVEYTLSETGGPSNYSAGSWSCQISATIGSGNLVGQDGYVPGREWRRLGTGW